MKMMIEIIKPEESVASTGAQKSEGKAKTGQKHVAHPGHSHDDDDDDNGNDNDDYYRICLGGYVMIKGKIEHDAGTPQICHGKCEHLRWREMTNMMFGSEVALRAT